MDADGPPEHSLLLHLLKFSEAERDQLWGWIAQTWDAVHVPGDHRHLGVLYSWDCESTAWFRPEQHLEAVPVPECQPSPQGR